MVAKITFPKRVEAALNYNEQKVQKGKAACLFASGYLKDAGYMNFHQKLQGLERNNQLNQNATTKTLHVSLNFDPSERLSNEKLASIAALYMERLGFSEQPYLVYRHEDAGHPHIHIVSTTIRDDGSRISTHNIGRNASETARKEIEKRFGLVRAERGTRIAPYQPSQIAVGKAVYGKAETKKAIAGVVAHVFNYYRFSSLPQFNAALRQFGVVADRGKEGGRIYNNGGLVYSLLDEQENKVGVPLKASTLSCRPTLKALEQKFGETEPLKMEAMTRLKKLLDATAPKAGNLPAFVQQLASQNVFLLPRQSADGKIYGLTFVDNTTKCVFNGSDLGKEYSAAAMLNRLATQPSEIRQVTENNQQGSSSAASRIKNEHLTPGHKELPKKELQYLADLLLSPKEQHDNTPQGLLQKKRKKKKRINPNSSL